MLAKIPATRRPTRKREVLTTSDYFGLVKVTVEFVVVLTELVTVPRVLWAMAGIARARRTKAVLRRVFFIE